MTLFLTVIAFIFLERTLVFIVFSPTPRALPLSLTLSVLFFLTLGRLPTLEIAVAFVIGRWGERWAVLNLSYLKIFVWGGAKVEAFRVFVGCFAGKGYLQCLVKGKIGLL